ncbi:MAG: hypothetical protein OEW04_10220, partial [Nitrospirota bacterium]|nr:hypothetical protein [Nitrospirota bacterium]
CIVTVPISRHDLAEPPSKQCLHIIIGVSDIPAVFYASGNTDVSCTLLSACRINNNPASEVISFP